MSPVNVLVSLTHTAETVSAIRKEIIGRSQRTKHLVWNGLVSENNLGGLDVACATRIGTSMKALLLNQEATNLQPFRQHTTRTQISQYLSLR